MAAKHLVLSLLLLPALVGAQAKPQTPVSTGPTIQLPKITRATLDNGLRLVLMEYHRAPSVSFRCIIRGGSSQDPTAKAGVADLMADLLTQGTDKRSATELAEEIDLLGANLSASAGADGIYVNLDLLASELDAGLGLLADVLRTPQFAQEELDRQKQLRLSDLRTITEDPSAIADRLSVEVAYAGHAYGILSTVASIQTITRDDVIDYYKNHVSPNNMVLAVVGDFSSASMLAKLKAKFSDWQQGSSAAIKLPLVVEQAPKIVVVDKPDATQTQVRLIRSGISRTSPDYFAAQVASAILGGGFTSRLIEEVRVNRSLTYGISSDFDERMYGGAFGIDTFTKQETTRELLDVTRKVLAETAAKGVTAQELARLKSFLIGSFAAQVQTPEALARQLAQIEFYRLSPTYLQDYLSKIQAVTLEQVNRVAKTYFTPEKLSIILVTPLEKTRPQLAGLGKVEERNLATIGK